MPGELEMYAWKTKNAVASAPAQSDNDEGMDVRGFYSRGQLVAIAYRREVYDGEFKWFLSILDKELLHWKQRRHTRYLREHPYGPDENLVSIEEVTVSELETLITELGNEITTAYIGPTVVGDPVLLFTGEELQVVFSAEMSDTPTLAGWYYIIDAGTPQEFAAVERDGAATEQYNFTIDDPIPEYDEVVEIGYNFLIGDTETAAGAALGLLFGVGVDNQRAEPPTIEALAVNNAGNTIRVTCSEAMADPIGKHAQFSFTQDGETRALSAAARQHDDFTLLLLTVDGTPIPDGAVVTLDVLAGPTDYIMANVGNGYLREELDVAVQNTSMIPAPVNAATNVAGTTITIAFQKDMADPAGKHAEFGYAIEGGEGQAFGAAALVEGTPNQIVLTCAGDLPVYGEEVTVSYTVGTVTAEDTGILASFEDFPVINELEEPPVLADAETDATTMILEFDKPMSDPAGHHALFTFRRNADDPKTVGAIALHETDTTKFVLTSLEEAPAYGETIDVTYVGATRVITSEDGGILDSFANEGVTNNVPQ